MSLPETSHHHTSYYRWYNSFSGTSLHRPMHLLIESVSWIRKVLLLSLTQVFSSYSLFWVEWVWGGLSRLRSVEEGKRQLWYYCLSLKRPIQKRFIFVYGRKWNLVVSFLFTAGNAIGYIHISLTAHIAISLFDFMVKLCNPVKLLNGSRSLRSKETPNWVRQSYRFDQCAGSATADWFTCWSDATKQALMKWIPSGSFALQKDLSLGISPSLFLIVRNTRR